jgi:BlaI family penicillinase repressor
MGKQTSTFIYEKRRRTLTTNISDAEWKIMEILWEDAPGTITEITKALKGVTGWTKHTVITLLKRLEEKGAIYYEEGERAKQYYPRLKREDAARQETEEFLDKVYHGRMGLMLNAMVQQKALSAEEIDELYQILENERGKQS